MCTFTSKYCHFLGLQFWAFTRQEGTQIALLKYNGGGDWYANPTSLTNLIKFCNENLGTNLQKDYATVEVGSPEIFNYPFIHMTGHGNVYFNEEEARISGIT